MEGVDYLAREGYLRLLKKHIEDLAEVPLEYLPTPRAIAVDAPWGNGKSWVANRLKAELTATADDSQRVVLVDAFRQDHNGDAFAVIASAIYKELKPQGEAQKKFLSTTGEVLKAGAPAVAKGLVKIGLSAFGVAEAVQSVAEEVTDAVGNAAAKGSEKAVEALLDAYGKSEWAQEQFARMLHEQTSELTKPLMVLLDELDRCRPSFALEVLERIKHLFAVDKVVFVLFWNSAAIHEIIRHTYGREVDAERYLSKFVAYTLPLPVHSIDNRITDNALGHFVSKQLAARKTAGEDFAFGLTKLASVLGATLRDIEKAIHLYCTLPSGRRVEGVPFAYLALLKTISEHRFNRVVASDRATCGDEAKLLQAHLEDANTGYHMFWALFSALSYRASPESYQNLNRNDSQVDETTKRMLEHMFGHQPTMRWFDAAAKRLTQDLGSA
jgi:hypothetical protein